MFVPDYIAQRIRRPLPAISPQVVVAGSTPVVGFGDVLSAKVATLGLNPSRVEFLDRNCVELTEENRRLETLKSLGIDDLYSASDPVVARAFASCHGYFQKNPYRRWFDQL